MPASSQEARIAGVNHEGLAKEIFLLKNIVEQKAYLKIINLVQKCGNLYLFY
jgi:hypothetical protein